MPTKQSKSLVKAQEHNEQLRKAYRNFKNSSDGKIIMADLEKRFYHVDMTTETEHKACTKIGRHNVVFYIRTMGEEK